MVYYGALERELHSLFASMRIHDSEWRYHKMFRILMLI